mmetsp:Transcript_82300/g.133559  ORF Transcript_82300/g.133559 Transcript_82300/m.133559 type:complete len:219 (-) Transcript_82300:496-1152(-)
MEESLAPQLEGMTDPSLSSVEDLDLRRATLQIEQKRIFLNLRENVRGRYLRIAEVTGNNRSTIIVPSSGLLQFRALLDDFIENDSAVVMGQQAMLADGLGGEFGGVVVTSSSKPKKKRGKKIGADGESHEPVQGSPEDDDKRVFVGNLAWSTNGQGLKDHFSQCGELLRADVFTERSGRSRGCGLVEFSSAEMAKNAMDSMNNTELDGRPIFVREDRR